MFLEFIKMNNSLKWSFGNNFLLYFYIHEFFMKIPWVLVVLMHVNSKFKMLKLVIYYTEEKLAKKSIIIKWKSFHQKKTKLLFPCQSWQEWKHVQLKSILLCISSPNFFLWLFLFIFFWYKEKLLRKSLKD